MQFLSLLLLVERIIKVLGIWDLLSIFCYYIFVRIESLFILKRNLYLR